MKFIETNPERCNLQSRILNSLCRSRHRPLDQSGSTQDAGGTQSGPSPYNLVQGLLLKRQARRRATTGTVRLHRECGLLELLLPPARGQGQGHEEGHQVAAVASGESRDVASAGPSRERAKARSATQLSQLSLLSCWCPRG